MWLRYVLVRFTNAHKHRERETAEEEEVNISFKLYWLFCASPLSVESQMKFAQSPPETSTSSVFFILEAAFSQKATADKHNGPDLLKSVWNTKTQESRGFNILNTSPEIQTRSQGYFQIGIRPQTFLVRRSKGH